MKRVAATTSDGALPHPHQEESMWQAFDGMSWKQRGVCVALNSGHDPHRPCDQQGTSRRADQVLRARRTEHRHCHDQRQHDNVLRCRWRVHWLRNDHRQTLKQSAGPAMTLQEAKSIARHLGLTLRQVRSGDYRVNFRDGNETTAYYTNDLEDAVNTAVEMVRLRERELHRAMGRAQN
jgi:hypothetical protein